MFFSEHYFNLDLILGIVLHIKCREQSNTQPSLDFPFSINYTCFSLKKERQLTSRLPEGGSNRATSSNQKTHRASCNQITAALPRLEKPHTFEKIDQRHHDVPFDRGKRQQETTKKWEN